MLKLKDKNKKLIAGLINYKDLCIESILASGDKKLSFSLPKEDKFYNFIEEECYIETKTQEYVIKARDVGVDYTRFDCVLNLETLEANIFDRFESVEQTITASLNLAIVGTGWTVKDNTLKKKRTVRCTNKNALEIVQEIKKTYRVDIVFNTLKREIEVYEHLGEDKGTYFIDSLNLTALQVQSDSYKFATRIIAEGKDGLTFADINGGKNYVENYQYSRKVKTIYWKDERYTIKESLLEDAKAKLKEISKPYTSYNASVLNLAELNPKYKSILDYLLGDTITLISRNNKVKDKQRIVKILEYPQDHSRDTVELANAVLKFEDIQQENQETTSTVNNITVDDGTIDGSTIDGIKVKQIEDFKANVVEVVNLKAINANIDNLHANKADIQDLHAVTAKIGTLEATKANITQLNAVNAEISKLNSIKANVTDLNAAVGKINVLESKTASIDNLLAGNLTANNFKANSITASSGIIADGAIGDAQISSLNANKMRAGILDTSLVTVAGPNGRLKILGNRLQIFDDVNNKLFERIMLGINDKNRACLTLRATDGQTVLLTEEGLTKAGITDGFGKADDNSLSALKLDKNSIVRQVNVATETIAGTRIQVGDRTLDVELSTQKNTITENSKELSSQKATIQALDNAIKLKVDSQTFTQSTNTINNNINKAKEEAINSANNNTTNAINNIKIGGRNLLLNTVFDKDFSPWKIQYATGFSRYLGNEYEQYFYKGCTFINNRVNSTAILTQNINLKAEKEYILRFYDFYDSLIRYWVGIYYKVNQEEKYITLKDDMSKNNCGWKENIYKISLPKDAQNISLRFYHYGVLKNGDRGGLWIANLKLEEGSKCSDWTPAPEDLQAYSDEVAKAESELAKEQSKAYADGKITEEERKRIQQAQENLNTAIAKAEKAKQDAINTASTDATNKANNALNSAKAFVNSEITTVNSHLNKATSEINVLKEKIESKVSQSDIDKSIQEIKFSDVNLILNSGNFNNIDNWFNNGGNPILEKKDGFNCLKATGSIKHEKIKLEHDNSYIYWCEIMFNSDVEVNGTFPLHHWLNSSGNAGDSACYGYEVLEGLGIAKANTWHKIVLRFKTKTKEQFPEDIYLTPFIYKYPMPETFWLKYISLTKGNKFIDGWTPNPFDVDQTILNNIKTVTDKISTVESKLTQENNSIKASVQDLNSTTQTITTNVSNLNRDLTSKINSNLDAAKDFATSKATEALNNAKYYTNAQINTVNSKVSNVESNLNILKDKIESKVSQSDIDKSISNIELGGRNLLLNTLFDGDKTPWKATNFTMFSKYSGIKEENFLYKGCILKNNKIDSPAILSQSINIKTGLEHTLSFYEFTDTIKRYWIGVYYKLNNETKYITFRDWGKEYSVWTKRIYKFTIPKGATEIELRFYHYGVNIENDRGIIWLANLKLEEGSKCSDWTPAPEDTTNFIVDNIKLVNSKISDVSSSVTQLRDSVTTQINSINSKTQSIETNLNGKATKQEVTAVDSKVTTIKADLSSITQRVSNSEVKTNKLNDNIQSLSSRMQSAEQKITPTSIINTVSSTIDTKVNALKNDVNNKIVASGKALDNLRNDMNGAFKDGILTEAEKKDLEKQLNDLEVERNSVLGEVDSLMKNEALQNTNQLIALNNAKKEFIDNHFNLINAIRKAVNLAQLAKPSVPNVSIFKDVKLHYPHFSDKHYPAYPDVSVIENHNGEVYLVDGGENCNKYDVEKYLKSKNIYKIDKVFVTHSHSDHIEGLPYLLEKFGCKELYIKTPNWSRMPAIELGEWKTKQYHEILIDKANSIGAKIIELNSDRTINLSDRSTLRVVNTQNNDYSNYNSISLGFLFEFKVSNNTKRRYFIQGDMSYQSENFVGGQNIGKIDILKLGHHGNKDSNGETWLNYLKPAYSVATLGYPLGNQVKLNAMRCKFVSSKVYLPNDNPNHMSITIDKDSGAITTSAIEHKITNTWYQRDNGDWYYFDSNGGWAHDTSLVINNRRYRFNSDGLCLNPKGDSL